MEAATAAADATALKEAAERAQQAAQAAGEEDLVAKARAELAAAKANLEMAKQEAWKMKKTMKTEKKMNLLVGSGCDATLQASAVRSPRFRRGV